MPDMFQAGDTAPHSGVYKVIHAEARPHSAGAFVFSTCYYFGP
jgi:hypothetical protein